MVEIERSRDDQKEIGALIFAGVSVSFHKRRRERLFDMLTIYVKGCDLGRERDRERGGDADRQKGTERGEKEKKKESIYRVRLGRSGVGMRSQIKSTQPILWIFIEF